MGRARTTESGGTDMRILKTALSLLCGVVLLATLAPPAEAATTPVPLTCGMVLNRDAEVYLPRDLYCPDFAIRVEQDHSGDVPPPHVQVDLRGHTLRGPGTGNGITAFSGGQGITFVQVMNGRLKNWGIAVGGDYNFRTSSVVLVGNRIGLVCGGFDCVADRTYFQGNSVTGLSVSADASGAATRSTFVGNKVGASVSWIWSLNIESSAFVSNDIGVLASNARVSVAKSLFIKNKTAIRVTNDSVDPFGCAQLNRVVFVKNRVRVDGPTCAA